MKNSRNKIVKLWKIELKIQLIDGYIHKNNMTIFNFGQLMGEGRWWCQITNRKVK